MTETPQQQDSHPDTSGFDRDALRDFDRLRRSTTDRKIAGVAGGLGRHLNIDPTILRVVFVVLVFFGGAGLLLYGAAWVLVPEDGSDEAAITTSPGTRTTALIVAGVVGALLVLGDSWGGFSFPWPLAIIALIVVLYLVNRDRPKTSSPSTGAGGWVGSTPPPAMGAAGLGRSSTGWVVDDSSATRQADESAGAGYGTYDQPPPPPYGPASWAPQYQAPPPRPSRKERGPKLFGFTLAFIALGLGLLGLVDASGASVVDAAYPALALTIIGAMLIWGSVAGRPGGLIFLGLIASVALLVSSAVQDYGWDEPDTRTFTPTSAAELAADYTYFAGTTRVDLTQVSDPENLGGRTLDLRAEAGEIVVIVPEGLTVDVDARIGIGGEIDVDGVRDEGRSPTVVDQIDGGDEAPEMRIDIDLSVGSIDVQQEEAA
ncbi:MAG: PspC domain-containing protein [Nocardioides sp.]